MCSKFPSSTCLRGCLSSFDPYQECDGWHYMSLFLSFVLWASACSSWTIFSSMNLFLLQAERSKITHLTTVTEHRRHYAKYVNGEIQHTRAHPLGLHFFEFHFTRPIDGKYHSGFQKLEWIGALLPWHFFLCVKDSRLYNMVWGLWHGVEDEWHWMKFH